MEIEEEIPYQNCTKKRDTEKSKAACGREEMKEPNLWVSGEENKYIQGRKYMEKSLLNNT